MHSPPLRSIPAAPLPYLRSYPVLSNPILPFLAMPLQSFPFLSCQSTTVLSLHSRSATFRDLPLQPFQCSQRQSRPLLSATLPSLPAAPIRFPPVCAPPSPSIPAAPILILARSILYAPRRSSHPAPPAGPIRSDPLLAFPLRPVRSAPLLSVPIQYRPARPLCYPFLFIPFQPSRFLARHA